MRHSFMFLPMFALVMVALLAGCGGREEPAGPTPDTAAPESPDAAPGEAWIADAEPVKGDWLIQRLPAEMDHLNPLTSTDAYASRIMNYVFDGLLDRDPETMEMIPNLAESWEISEDHLTYTFHLRDGLMFSDGEPLDSDDVKFTFEMLMNPEVDAPHLRNYYKDVVSCEVPDAKTVVFTCTKPYYRHLVMLGGLDVLPRHVYGEGDFNNHPNNRKPVGSGPYTLDLWETGQRVVLSRNEKFWGEVVDIHPWIDRLVFKIITDDTTSFQALRKGDLDAMNVRPEDWVRRGSEPDFEAKFDKYEYYAPQYSYIGWNSNRPMFQDKRVRRALTMLLDRDKIRDSIYEGLARVVTGNFMPGTPAHNESIEPWPYDPEAALALLEEAGWTDTNSNGLLDKDGREFQFELLTVASSDTGEKIATFYKEELSRVGIELNIRQLEWATMAERVRQREFDANMMGWSMPPDPDPYQVWHSSQADTGSNYVGFRNEEADRLIEDARQSFDSEARNQLYHRFHEIMHEEQPYTFMFAPKTLLAVAKRVHGVTMYTYGPQPLEWFVPEPLQRYGE